MRVKVFLRLALVLFACALNAPAMTLHLHWPAGVEPRAGTIVVRDPGGAREELRIPVDAGAQAVDLPDGEWFVSATFDGLWSDVALVTSRSGADLSLFPATRLRARIDLPEGRKSAPLRLYLQKSDAAETHGPLRGTSVCDVKEQQAICVVPAGTYDLTFRVEGCASVQRWEVGFANSRELVMGKLTFKEGSTLSGSVTANQKNFDSTTASVLITPAAPADANDELRRRLRVASTVVHPNRRGNFAIDLAPGRYSIVARAAGLVSEERAVSITEGQESVLRKPLELMKPATVTVYVHPPRDPLGAAWRIELARVDENRVVLARRQSGADLTGSCRFEASVPGSYLVRITRRSEETWAADSLEVLDDASIDVNVPITTVRGRVTRASKPVPALLEFQSAGSGVHVKVGTAGDGTFTAQLPSPPDDEWDSIEALTTGHSKTKLRNVRMTCHDDGTASMSISLPDSLLSGFVVDEDGRPSGPALIDVADQAGVVEQHESEDGRFEISGLSPGAYRLRARTSSAETESSVSVHLDKSDSRVSDVKLIVGHTTRFRGSVVSADGPQPSSAMFVVPVGDFNTPLVMRPVGPLGSFDVQLRPGTREVVAVVRTPGFSSRFLRTMLTEQATSIAINQQGGRLTVDEPPTRRGVRPFIVHDGAVLPAPHLAYLAGGRFLASPQTRIYVEIAMIEPGVYGLCWLSEAEASAGIFSPDACTVGTLTPFGELVFRDSGGARER